MDENVILDDILREKASKEKVILPEDLEVKIKETIAGLPNRKKSKGKFMKKVSIAAAITIATITSLSAVFPAYGRNVPIVSSVFQFLSDKNLIDKEYVKYSSDLNISQISNDVTVTINSIVYDGIELSVGYTVESKNELKGLPHMLDKDFKINGKKTSFSSGGNGNLIDKKTFVGVNNFQVANDYLPNEVKKHIVGGDVKIPDNFIMELNIKEFSEGTKGQWDFKFKVSIDKIKEKVQVINTDIDLSDIIPYANVNEVIFSPLNTVLRTVEKNTGSDEITQYLVFDDKGRTLKWKGTSGNGSGEANKIYWQYTFRSIFEDTKKVTFIPAVLSKDYVERLKSYGGKYEGENKEVELKFNEPTVLSLGRLGEYKVNKIESFKDKTLIYFECTNMLSAMEIYGVKIKDDLGKEYELLPDKVKELDSSKFVLEVEPLSNNRKYKLVAVDLEKKYDVRNDLKFTIELK